MPFSPPPTQTQPTAKCSAHESRINNNAIPQEGKHMLAAQWDRMEWEWSEHTRKYNSMEVQMQPPSWFLGIPKTPE